MGAKVMNRGSTTSSVGLHLSQFSESFPSYVETVSMQRLVAKKRHLSLIKLILKRCSVKRPFYGTVQITCL